MAELTISICSDANAIPVLAAAVRGALDHLQVDSLDAEAAVLGMVETLNNCVAHAYRNRGDGSITVHCSVLDALLEISIDDRGEPLRQMPSAWLPAPDAEHGRGWFIIDACFDHCELSRAGGVNTVTLRKRLRQ